MYDSSSLQLFKTKIKIKQKTKKYNGSEKMDGCLGIKRCIGW